MIKAVIFDVDGVLIDSFKVNFECFQKIFKEIGYKRLTEKKFAEAFHLTLKDAVRFLTGVDDEEELERISKITYKVFAAPEKTILPKDSVEIVKELSKDYKLGIVTGRIKVGVNEYFNAAKTKKYFQTAVDLSQYKNTKPHPESLLVAVKKLKIKPSEAIYIGDALTDIQAAKKAGMKSILYSRKKIKGADCKTYSFKSLPSLINKLN